MVSNRLPCKPGVTGSIPDFTSLLDETKPWPRLHMILAVGGTLNNMHAGAIRTLLMVVHMYGR